MWQIVLAACEDSAKVRDSQLKVLKDDRVNLMNQLIEAKEEASNFAHKHEGAAADLEMSRLEVTKLEKEIFQKSEVLQVVLLGLLLLWTINGNIFRHRASRPRLLDSRPKAMNCRQYLLIFFHVQGIRFKLNELELQLEEEAAASNP
jgi:hypothetical protein